MTNPVAGNQHSSITETVDQRFQNLDQMPIGDLVKLMNEVDRDVPLAISKSLDQITAAIEAVSENYLAGGRIIYVGAGTSGRIATLDASEIYPTFGVSNRVIAVMAGGKDALVNPSEGAEDDGESGARAISNLQVFKNDTVIGVASSGSTPFVLQAIEEAKRRGATTVGIACNSSSDLGAISHHPIEVVVGPEVIAGSTRLKAGTAQKMILNMISTITMVQAGKTYGNMMVDVVASNTKLKRRAKNIVSELAEVDLATAEQALVECGWNVKRSIVSLKLGVSANDAAVLLEKSNGYLAMALGESN